MFSNTNNVVFATGNGTTGEYNFTYPIQKLDDIIVKVRNINDGEISTLTVNTDFLTTITGINGGKINFIDNGQAWLDGSGNLISDYELMIKRSPFINQTSDFRNAGPYFAELHEDRFDRQTYFDQELKEALDRAAKFDEFVQYNLPGTYPRLPRPEANKFLKWSPDESGELINDEQVVDLSDYYTMAEVDALLLGKLDVPSGTPTTDDFLVFDGASWEPKTIDSDSIPEGSSNLYYTDARAKADTVVDSLAGGETDMAPSVLATSTALSGKANASHTHALSDLTQSGAINGQVATWNNISGEWEPQTPASGVTDHGLLTGLADDDHSQYHNDARGDARYYTKSQVDTLIEALFPVGSLGWSWAIDTPPNTLVNWLNITNFEYTFDTDANPEFIPLYNHLELYNLWEQSPGENGIFVKTSSTVFTIRNIGGLSPMGVGVHSSDFFGGRLKVGPEKGCALEDQMQKITGQFGRVISTSSNGSGAFTLTANQGSIDGYRIPNPGTTTNSRSGVFNSSTSPDARTSSLTEGPTRTSGFGVYFWIRY